MVLCMQEGDVSCPKTQLVFFHSPFPYPAPPLALSLSYFFQQEVGSLMLFLTLQHASDGDTF